MSNIKIKNAKKSYDNLEVLHGIDLDIKEGEFVVLVGPSGCGKSTLLRMIAGLEEITAGEISIADKVVNNIHPSKRNVSMVFQNYALYPHMTVYDNIAFGLRIQRLTKDTIDQKVKEAAEMLGLTEYLERKPAALSGGQRQRVAMGRAIVKNAGIILFDEPLSNLDAKLRAKMRAEIKRRHLQTKTTTVYVTHDQLEAMTLADRLVIMKDGVIEQVGTPMEVYERPKNQFVATFIGSPSMNLFNLNIEKGPTGYFLKDKTGKFSIKVPAEKEAHLREKSEIILGLRPSDIFISKDNDGLPDEWKQKGRVEIVETLGKNAYITFELGDEVFLGEIAGRMLPKFGDKVNISFNLHHMQLFDHNTHLSLIN